MMSNITVTQDNLSKFTKRLHKALIEHHTQHTAPPTLSQSAELFAKALGTTNLHELHTVLAAPLTATELTAPETPSCVELSFEEQWVTDTEQFIRDHVARYPYTILNGMSWASDGSGMYLRLYPPLCDGDWGWRFSFKTSPKEKAVSETWLELYDTEIIRRPDDQDFLDMLIETFPRDVSDNVKIVEFLSKNRHVTNETPHQIVPPVPKAKPKR